MPKYINFAAIAFWLFACSANCFGNAGTIAFSPTSWNAGIIDDGSQNAKTITIKNTGSAPVTIKAINGVGSSEFAIGGITLPKTIPGKGKATFTVIFSPTTGGLATGTVTVVSTATNSPKLSVKGTGWYVVNLTWDPSPSASDPCYSNVGYNVYVSTLDGPPFSELASLVTTTSYTDDSEQPGFIYYYVVTFYGDYTNSGSCPNASGWAESGYSNIAQASIP